MDPNAAIRRSLRNDANLSGPALFKAGVAATGAGLFEEARKRFIAETAGRGRNDARMWQVLGLAERGLQDSAAAHQAFARAAALAPRDALIAHSCARTALEAGFPALALFDRARGLAPQDGAIVLGRAAAQAAEGRADVAITELGALMANNPGWIDGHLALARLTASTAPGRDPVGALAAALQRFPRQTELWNAMARVLGEAESWDRARATLDEAARHVGDTPELRLLRGYILNESGDAEAALDALEPLAPPWQAQARIHRLRALLRLERIDRATALIETCPQADRDLWPYRMVLWRLAGDPRWAAAEGDARLISVHDLSAQVDLPRLAHVLRGLHKASGRMLDQSARGGTQTEGNLLARAEPDIRALRAAVMAAVEAHVRALPPPMPDHPTLVPARAALRVAGAWSVRLSGAGFHVDHVHQRGWLSSAFYVALPEGDEGIGASDDDPAGWLTFGECRTVCPAMPAFRKVQPRPGTLAIFPSTTWHGTRPFSAGERLTVAFDIAPPPQDPR